MREALHLAVLGRGRVNPNPLVGAVIVKDGRKIAQGYHAVYGGPHAERCALDNCSEDPRGATMYVTLEPCCHHGKTPPCTEAILASGIARVVIGSTDPNPKVAGGGVAALEDAGITVIRDVLRENCDGLNAVFFHYILGKTPHVTMKYAMTADGKIATHTGASRWITGIAAREAVHRTRGTLSAILVGLGTVLLDDPLLTCRLSEGGRNPLRIVADSRLAIPLGSQIVTTAREVPTVIACHTAETSQARRLEALGCRILPCPGSDGRVDLRMLLEKLHAEGIDSVLAEGGAALHYSLLEAGLVQRLQVYVAPKIFGGATAKGPVGGEGVSLPEQAFRLSLPRITPLEEDLLLEYDVLGGG